MSLIQDSTLPPETLKELAAITIKLCLPEKTVVRLLKAPPQYWEAISSITDKLNDDLEKVNCPDSAKLAAIALKNKYGLTNREVQVLYLLAIGLDYQDIAKKFVVALTTVKTHVNWLFNKLGTSCRSGAICVAHAYEFPAPAVLKALLAA